MDLGRSFSNVQDEMRTSKDSSRDQAGCNHCYHFLLESHLTMISASCWFVGDNSLMTLIVECGLMFWIGFAYPLKT